MWNQYRKGGKDLTRERRRAENQRGGIWNSYLFDLGKPVAPIWFFQALFATMFQDLCEIELRSVPAANAIVCTKITLHLKMVRCGSIPLEVQLSIFFKNRKCIYDLQCYKRTCPCTSDAFLPDLLPGSNCYPLLYSQCWISFPQSRTREPKQNIQKILQLHRCLKYSLPG